MADFRTSVVMAPVKWDDPAGSWLTPDRCGIQEDTPEARRALEKSLAQNDNFPGLGIG